MSSNTFWTCASATPATEKCPEGIRPADVMYALTRYSLWNDTTSTVTGWRPASRVASPRTILRTGKSYEPGLRPGLHLRGAVSGGVLKRDADGAQAARQGPVAADPPPGSNGSASCGAMVGRVLLPLDGIE